jgi:hypothetical protein
MALSFFRTGNFVYDAIVLSSGLKVNVYNLYKDLII